MIDPPLNPVAEAASLAAEVRRVAAALLEDALGHLVEPERRGVEKSVHETRKRIKELRALLRLVRSSLADASGERVRDAENDACRAAARGLGDARDAAVRIQTLQAVRERFPQALNDTLYEQMSSALSAEHELLLTDSNAGIAQAHAILLAMRQRVDDWRIAPGKARRARTPEEAWSALAPDLARIYRRGRQAMRSACAGSDAESWHAWRRRAKDLRYALELLRKGAAPILNATAEVAKKLTDLLGEDHDLAVLLEWTLEHHPAGAGAIESPIQQRRAQLAGEAGRVGAVLYAEPAQAFVHRLEAYWRAGQAPAARDL